MPGWKLLPGVEPVKLRSKAVAGTYLGVGRVVRIDIAVPDVHAVAGPGEGRHRKMVRRGTLLQEEGDEVASADDQGLTDGGLHEGLEVGK